MTPRNLRFVLPLFIWGCSSGSATPPDLALPDGGTADLSAADLTSPPLPVGSNVAPLIVDEGPPGAFSVDVPFVSVTVCVPGTTTCQTIDHVTVDTGSSGLRIVASVISSLGLPQKMATTGDPLVECFQFDDGYTWGSVRLADIQIAGEKAANLPIQLVGDPQYSTIPGDCSSSGPPENTVREFGANGLIGINQFVADCGNDCSDSRNIAPGAYYACNATGCAPVAVAEADQVPNPIASFPTDNNGAILQFPSIPETGAATLAGALTFGIGTQPNNGLGSAQVITINPVGNFTTLYKGRTLATSFIDSGSNSLSFTDSSIPNCGASAAGSGYFCPATTLSLTAQNKGANGVTTTVSFAVANTNSLFSHGAYNVFADLAGPGSDNQTFDWGFPFFVGRIVYLALDGATTPGGVGPYYAY